MFENVVSASRWSYPELKEAEGELSRYGGFFSVCSVGKHVWDFWKAEGLFVLSTLTNGKHSDTLNMKQKTNSPLGNYEIWLLNGKSVFYAAFDSIRDTLDYDFGQERTFFLCRAGCYAGNQAYCKVYFRHLANSSFLWGQYPNNSCIDGKISENLRFPCEQSGFAENSWYFRNALVRANFTDLQNDVHSTPVFLEQFMENLLTGAHHDLKNRYMHIDYSEAAQSAIPSAK